MDDPEIASRNADDRTPGVETSIHIERAQGGDVASVTWVVEKFSPLLLASARYRLSANLRLLYDPEDLVSEVWAVTLPRLTHLEPRNGHYTPVLLKFLSTTLINKVNNLFQKHILGKPERQHAPSGESSEDSPDTLARLPKSLTGIVTRLARRETRQAVVESLDKLEEQDRELIILRGIEQHPYREIAAIVHAELTTLAVRYKRALEKLRKALPGSVYDEFVED